MKFIAVSALCVTCHGTILMKLCDERSSSTGWGQTCYSGTERDDKEPLPLGSYLIFNLDRGKFPLVSRFGCPLVNIVAGGLVQLERREFDCLAHYRHLLMSPAK